MGNKQLENEIIRRISGFRPMVIGGLCDMCNHAISVGEEVFVEMERHGNTWEPVRMHCSDCGIEIDSSSERISQAVAKVEVLSEHNHGEQYSVGNPEVEDISPEGESRGLYAK